MSDKVNSRHLLHLLVAATYNDATLLKHNLNPEKLRQEFNARFKKRVPIIENNPGRFVIDSGIETREFFPKYNLLVSARWHYSIIYYNNKFYVEKLCKETDSQTGEQINQHYEHKETIELNMLDFIEEYQASIIDLIQYFGAKAVLEDIKHTAKRDDSRLIKTDAYTDLL